MIPKTRILMLLAVASSFIVPTAGFRRLPHFSLFQRGGDSSVKPIQNEQKKAAAKEMGYLHNYVTSLFEAADTNHDGSIDPNEVYELVLKFYVKVNQQAPVPPPTRQRVMYLFQQADTVKNGRLNLDEFRRLMRTIYARASSRVVVFKIVSMLLAPATAVLVVNTVQATPFLMKIMGSLLPKQTPTFLVNLLSKESFWVTIFTVLTVKQLGKISFQFVDWLYWGRHPTHDDKMYENCETLKDK